MKKIISLILVLLVAFSAMTVCAEEITGDSYVVLAQAQNNKLFVNGIMMDFDAMNEKVVPFVDENGNCMVPLRAVVGTVGGWIDWIEETNTVVMLYNGVEISFVLDTNEIKVGDETVEVSVAPYTVYDRTVVTLDFFEKCLGAQTTFDEETKTVILGFITKVYAAG